MTPKFIVVDTRDGYVFWRDSKGEFFTEGTADEFVAERSPVCVVMAAVPVTKASARKPVNPEMFRHTAPQWNCVDFPNDGMHCISRDGGCAWCGMTGTEIAAENATNRRDN